MALGERFVQKDWRDFYDSDAGGFKEGSWYPGRNVSRWMDMLDKRDQYDVSTEYDAPGDINQELTSLAGDASTNIGLDMYGSSGEDNLGFKEDFYSNLTNIPTQEGIAQARMQNPELQGNVYGLSMQDSELMQPDPFVPGGTQGSYTDETAYTDLEGNPIYGSGSQSITTDRWYPGKGVKNIFNMLTGQQPFGNPFTASETFQSDIPDTRLDQLVNSIKVPNVENQMYNEDFNSPNLSDYNGGY